MTDSDAVKLYGLVYEFLDAYVGQTLELTGAEILGALQPTSDGSMDPAAFATWRQVLSRAEVID